MTKTHTFTYICDDCTFIFQTFGRLTRGRQVTFCPNCGESAAVRKHKGVHKQKEEVTNLKTRWSKEELETLERCIGGTISVYQVVIMLGRSRDSVKMKLKRIKSGATV